MCERERECVYVCVRETVRLFVFIALRVYILYITGTFSPVISIYSDMSAVTALADCGVGYACSW